MKRGACGAAAPQRKGPKKQKWGSVSNDFQTSEKWNMKQSLLSFLKPSYHQQEFYKISNATLTEFEKLCWKSYWLRSNLRPYILKIQTNLKKMKELENEVEFLKA